MWEKLKNLDARIIYGLLVVSIIVPLIKPIGAPVSIMWTTERMFKEIESLKDGSRVMFSHDYSAGTLPELGPMAIVFYKHLARKNIKVYAVSSVIDGPMFATEALNVYKSAGKKYGEDFVNLGYFSGGSSGCTAMLKDIKAIYKADVAGTPVDQIPMMKDVKSIKDFELVISLNSGPVGGATVDVWIREVSVAHKQKFALGCTAIMTPVNLPYMQAGQCVGILGGLRGGAEYEAITKEFGDATMAMDAQSSTHVLILALILIGNIAHWVTKKPDKAKGA